MVKIIANYSKKLGLPKFSSHAFSVSVEIEVTDITQVEAQCHELYQLLQHSVDQEIQHTGFTPVSNDGNGRTYQLNGQRNGSNSPTPTNGHHQPQAKGVRWNCTDGQRTFILRLIEEHKMNKQDVEALAVQLYGIGVIQLDRMQASQLIEELLVKSGQPARQTRWKPQTRQAA